MISSVRVAMVCAAVTVLALVAPAAVAQADSASTTTLTLDPGVACSFGLQIDSTGSPQVNKTFQDPSGRLRILAAGKGSDLLFTNLASGATFTLKGNGSVAWTTIDVSGSARLTVTGHNVVIYFPTDVPAGPSTALVVGREDIAVDLATGHFMRLSRTGNTTDICAALI